MIHFGTQGVIPVYHLQSDMTTDVSHYKELKFIRNHYERD